MFWKSPKEKNKAKKGRIRDAMRKNIDTLFHSQELGIPEGMRETIVKGIPLVKGAVEILGEAIRKIDPTMAKNFVAKTNKNLAYTLSNMAPVLTNPSDTFSEKGKRLAFGKQALGNTYNNPNSANIPSQVVSEGGDVSQIPQHSINPNINLGSPYNATGVAKVGLQQLYKYNPRGTLSAYERVKMP